MHERRRQPPPIELAGYLRDMPALLLLHRLPTAMLGIGPLGDIAYANPACADMFGYADAAAVTRQHLPDLMTGHQDLTPRACVTTLRMPGAIINWNHAHDYVIRTMVSPPLLVRAADPLLLVSITDVTEWLWERKGAEALHQRNGHSP